MHDDRELVEKRITRVLRERIAPAVYREKIPLDLEYWRVPDEPVPVAAALNAIYQPFAVGTPWGAPWSTTWIRASGIVPPRWAGQRVEAVYDLGFTDRGPGFQAEALAYTFDGVPIKGIAPRNRYVPVGEQVEGGQRVVHLLEAAANPDIIGRGMLPTLLGDKSTAGAANLYLFTAADLAVLDEDVFHLRLDFEVLRELMYQLDLRDSRRHQILRSMEDALDVLGLDAVSSNAAAARMQLKKAMSRPASASAHSISAVGHAHIDSAWLWPLRETIRKSSRTFSNVTALSEEYPELVFACSQAQQYAWIKQHFPTIFERIKKGIASGSWAPVGGMWVEADGNLPGGEALARQLVHGTRFFRDELGVEPHGVWLPDSFGYTAAYPQLARLAGFDWFLTQKLSWNATNKFPHHTFWWEGIDGSRIFTHFPPADTYNGDFSGTELSHAQHNYAEKGRANSSLYPFGYGDGGGGPTREMLEKARRVADLEGSPRVSIEHPDAFFARALAEYPDAPVWTGELYLELHRGTYTSQAKTKQGNRRSEHLLREAELWAAAATLRCGTDYPSADLDRLWKTVLLNQFHDILPGSSIAWVHRQAEATYQAIAIELTEIIEKTSAALIGADNSQDESATVLNAAPTPFRGVLAMGPTPAAAAAVKLPGVQRLRNGGVSVFVDVPASGLTGLAAAVFGNAETDIAPVTVSHTDAGIVLANDHVAVTIDNDGLFASVFDRRVGRELIAAGLRANLLQIHPDFPNDWDAWDVDRHYRRNCVDIVDVDELEVLDRGPLIASVRIARTFCQSSIVQNVILRAESPRIEVATTIDWHEREKLLKVAFPMDIHAERFSGEIQFGHLSRPIFTNTSWDFARFEVPCHRWVHVGEPGYGAAVANDSTYGHEVIECSTPNPGPRPARNGTTVRLSLLRSPRAPDPSADQGVHHLTYALIPGADTADAIRHGYELNLPLRVVPGTVHEPSSLVATVSGSAIVESVKLADDGSGDLVLRIYESLGSHTTSRLRVGMKVLHATPCDLHEQPIPGSFSIATVDSTISLQLRPFQVMTLRMPPA